MASPIVATLTIESPSQEPRDIELHDGEELSIGRNKDNGVVLNDPAVSRRHSVISATTLGVVVADLQSTNGTQVNGERLSSMKDLTSGDRISIGATQITVRLVSGEMLGMERDSHTSRGKTVELKPVSAAVLLVRIRDYDQYAEALREQDLDDLFSRWRETVSTVVSASGGSVDKAIEASIVATWVGSALEELAEQAMSAAREIESQVSRESRSDIDFHYDLVVHAGQGLQARSVTDDDARRYTVLAEPINEAFELAERCGGADDGQNTAKGGAASGIPSSSLVLSEAAQELLSE